MSKKFKIEARVTQEEKEMIQRKAQEKKTSISALLINSVENHITVNLNTSDYRDLVIQFRRIGNNINSMIRDIRFNHIVSDSQMKGIEQHLKSLEELLKSEKQKINATKIEMQKMSARQLRELLEKQDKRVPDYLIYENISDHIVLQLRSFIDLTIQSDLDETYPPYIERFLETFDVYSYEYDQLVDFSNALDKQIYRINQKIIKEKSQLEEDDFILVLDTLDEYRKVRDE